MITRRSQYSRPQPLQFKGCGCPTCDETKASVHFGGYGGGLSGFFDDVGKGVSTLTTGLVSTVEKKSQKLEFALTAILVLTAIAASTGVFNSVRRR